MTFAYHPDDAGLSPQLMVACRHAPELLADIHSGLEARQTEIQIMTRLRKSWAHEVVRAAMVLVKSSRRAMEPGGKFARLRPRCAFFWTSPEALEQATPLAAAVHKARRMATIRPDAPLVVDACCGIGGDSLALGRHWPLFSLDISPVRSLMADWNLQSLGLQHLAMVADVLRMPLNIPPGSLGHIDPSRRSAGRRTRDELFPDISRVLDWASGFALSAVKLSPAADFNALPRAPLEILAVGSHVVEATLWLAKEQDSIALAARTATIISGDGTWELSAAPEPPAPAAPIDEFLFELSGAVTRAALAPNLSAALNISAASVDGGYATGPIAISHPAIRSFRVLRVVRFDPGRLRKEIASIAPQNPSPGPMMLEIKTRGGLKIDTDKLQKQLAPLCRESLAILIFASASGVVAAITQRIRDDHFRGDAAGGSGVC